MKKINIVKFLLIIILSISCKENSQKSTLKADEINIKNDALEVEQTNLNQEISLDGEWEFIDNPNNDDLPNMVFTLSIQKSNNNEFVAQYCAVAQKGNRIDCSNEQEFNIKGIIKGNKVVATFYSFFGNKKNQGDVELLLKNDNTLEWQITKEPSSEFYAPKKCLLNKKQTIAESKSNQNVTLPFNFEDYKNTSNKNSYKIYASEELPEIAKIINDQINEYPISIFMIDNGNLSFQTYVIQNDGDSLTQVLVNIKGDKVLASEIIGYESENYNTFTINKDLSIDMYRVDNDNSKTLTKTLQIKSDGSIVKK
jgi:hypothetical protein